MAGHTSEQSSRSSDPFSMYASPVGARFLRKANKIFEDFPVSKYIFFFVIFSIEIAIVFALGIYLIRWKPDEHRLHYTFDGPPMSSRAHQ